jgi:hypothetical protein
LTSGPQVIHAPEVRHDAACMRRGCVISSIFSQRGAETNGSMSLLT